MATQRLPLPFYEPPYPKNWPMEYIKKGLQIDDETYRKICRTVVAELERMGILGAMLNSDACKEQIDSIVKPLLSSYPAVMTGLPLPWLQKCVRVIAQKCNYNRKRKTVRTGAGSQSSKQDDRLPVCAANVTIPFIQTIEIINMENGQSTCCRVHEILLKALSVTQVTVDDLDYDMFLDIIRDDVGYNAEQHILVHADGVSRSLRISNRRAWKAAIFEMNHKGNTRGSFAIESIGR